MNMVEVAVWVCVNSEGEYETGESADDARERYEANIRPLEKEDGFRLVELTITLPAPEPIGVSVEIPGVEEEATVKVA